MQLEKLVESILNKHKSVFIPKLGMLSIANTGASLEGSSIVPNKTQIVLNTFETNQDGVLIHAVANEKNISFSEAESLVFAELDSWIQKLEQNNKISIPNCGDIVNKNGLYSFVEAPKSIFPSDFFGLNVLDIKNKKVSEDNLYSNVSKENTFKEEPVVEKIETPVVETPKVEEVIVETPAVESKIISIDDSLAEPVKEEEFTSSISHLLEQVKDKKVETNLNEESWAEIHHDEPIAQEEVIETHEDEIEESITNTTEEEQPTEIEEIEEKHETSSLSSFFSDDKKLEDFFSDDESNDDITEEDEDENSEETQEVYEEEVKEEKIITKFDDTKLFKGFNHYDNEYLDFSDNNYTGEQSRNWGKVAMLVGAFVGLAFLIPYLYASFKGNKFMGMDPLWGSAKQDIAKVAPPKPAVIDTTHKVSDTNQVAKIDTALKTVTPATTTLATTTPAVTTKTNVTPVTPPAKIETSSTKNIANNTTTKNSIKENTKTVTKNTVKESIEKTSTDKSTKLALSEVPTAVKSPKSNLNLVGKPYTTANYTKGNHYVSFGGFKIPANATKLRKDLNKLGVVTDVIMVEGTYKVVIPYTSKSHALTAAQDFPNTSIFE